MWCYAEAMTVTRRSVPLDDDDIARINRLAGDERAENMLAGYLHRQYLSSDALFLRALVVAGLTTIEQDIDARRYQELAASQDDEDAAFHHALRRRPRDAA